MMKRFYSLIVNRMRIGKGKCFSKKKQEIRYREPPIYFPKIE